MSQQTAVEWIAEKMEKLIPPGNQIAIYIMLEQAKQMEKIQMIEFAYNYSAQTVNEIYTPEEYYNKTYNK